MSVPEDERRRAQLRSLKLRALVRDHLGRDPAVEPDVFPLGAALREGSTAWVLLEDAPDRGLGPALAWALRQGAEDVRVLASAGTGVLARRAGEFAVPIEVWHVEDRQLLPAVAEPLGPPAPPDERHRALTSVIEEGGARPVVEHGVVIGEVRGLEVCRVVDDPVTGAVRLEVGVGAHDREAFAIMHGDVPTVDALRGVVAMVQEHRQPGVVEHPVSRLVPERLLRWELEQQPGDVGLDTFAPVAPPVPRPNVKDRVAASAIGATTDGRRVLVVCSVGVDLDVIPYAADARLAAGVTGGATGVDEVWVVTPSRDAVPITAELAGRLRQPVRLVTRSVERS